MKLEQLEVVNLKLAKRLKKLGYQQESLFSYRESSVNVILVKNPDYRLYGDFNHYSAPTSAELGQQLPEVYLNHIMVSKDKKTWYLDSGIDDFKSKTEADVRAKIMIYLLEQKNET